MAEFQPRYSNSTGPDQLRKIQPQLFKTYIPLLCISRGYMIYGLMVRAITTCKLTWIYDNVWV